MTIRLGAFIRPKATSNPQLTQRSAEHLVNDADMSGACGTRHTKGNDLETMFLSVREPTKTVSVTFDFNTTVRLGYLYIWNFNQTDGYLSGFKNVTVEYSADGETFFEFKGRQYPYVFACADGSPVLSATNLTSGEPLDFDGLSARFVRITPKGGKGDGNWGDYIEGQTRFGLGAVRFFRYRVEPQKGAYASVAAQCDCYGVLASDFGLTNGNHSIDPKTMFLSGVNPLLDSFTVDSSLTATFSGIKIYNYNDASNLGAGIKKYILSYSIDGNKWTDILQGELPRGSGLSDYKGTELNFKSTVYARFFRLTSIGGAGEGTWGSCNGFEFRRGISKIMPRFSDSGYYFESAREWTALLSSYRGWGGADGIFAAPLCGSEKVPLGETAKDFKTLLLFSDSFVGESNPVTKSRRKGSFVNNTMGYMTGVDPQTLKLDFVYGKNGDMTATHILKNENPWFYWMQDCAVIGDKFYVFTDNVMQDNSPELPEGFKFRLTGVDLISFNIVDGKLDYQSQKNVRTPLFFGDKTPSYFGCGVLVNTHENGMEHGDGYVYVYGVGGYSISGKELLCARVKPNDIENFEKYTFFDGKEFVPDMQKSKPICDELSPEMSVMPIDGGRNKGKYLYTYSFGGVGESIRCRIGNTPYAFGEASDVFYIGDIEDLDKRKIPRVYQYNAKAHYQLSQREALITYNVNTMDYESHLTCADIYRPRFVRGREY